MALGAVKLNQSQAAEVPIKAGLQEFGHHNAPENADDLAEIIGKGKVESVGNDFFSAQGMLALIKRIFRMLPLVDAGGFIFSCDENRFPPPPFYGGKRSCRVLNICNKLI